MLPAVEGWILQIRDLNLGSGEALDGDFVKDLCLDRVYQSKDETGQQFWNISPTPLEPLVHMTAVQTLSSTNMDTQAIQQIKKWLRTCTEEHADCGAHRERMPLFSTHSTFRLVDVGTRTNDNIRLVEVCSGQDTGDLQNEYSRYITLSYRWTAETGRTSLKTENKAQFEQFIPTDDWPKVYHDAVSIAHQLDVRYLWIDSLCIIQDQTEDWLTQAALMGTIYSGGLLNLAAVQGSGLEVSRHPLRVAPCLLTLQTPEVLGLDSRLTKWLCYRPDDIRKAVDRAPLYKRGWYFQERVLSRRTVHFGDQLFWECTTLRASEAFPLRTEVPTRQDYVDAAIRDIKLDLQTEDPSHERHLARYHRRWCSIVRCYTQTELTKPSDRLTALKGIASAMASQFRHSQTDYLAGLWKPNIAIHLLWARQSESYSPADEILADQLANHFPSWSWASCPGETRFIEVNKSPWSRPLVRFDRGQASDDAARAVNLSFLVLRGWPVRCGPVERWLAGQNRYQEDFYFLSTSGGNGGVVSSTGPMVIVKIELDRPVSNLRQAVYLLPVLMNFGVATGLVLVSTGRIMGAGLVAYRRLGYFKCADGMKLMEMLGARLKNGSVDDLEFLDTFCPFILL